MSRMSLYVKICCVLCLYSTKAVAIFKILTGSPDDPDMHTNISGLITNKGYPLEEHWVQTSDGYILSLLRIPHGRNSSSATGKKDVVLLVHGVTLDASMWVINLPNQSLGFALPDAGYDVWLLSTRGTTYSRIHVKYTPNQYQFWNFSFDQLALYDVPETIDYILKATGEENLIFIGFSQGTTATFAMLSEVPDYNDKVKLFVGLAPAGSTGHLSSTALRLLTIIKDEFNLAVTLTTSGELLSNRMFKSFRVKFCSMYGRKFCQDIVSLAVGRDRTQVNQTRVGVYSAHIPGGTSVKSVVHYGQMVESNKFRKYDYRRHLNLKYYHQKDPPNYDVSRITTPVALFWSKADPLAHPKDVAILRRNLNTVVFDYCVPYRYNHFDFFIAMNAPLLINKPLLQLLSQYSNV